MTQTTTPNAVAWGHGTEIPGTPFRVAVPAGATDNHAVVLTVDMPPDLHVDPHTHADEDQINIVVSGVVEARVGDVLSRLEAGSILLMPRGIQHELWNAGDGFAQVIEIYTPPGMETVFADAGALAAARGQAVATGEDYGNI